MDKLNRIAQRVLSKNRNSVKDALSLLKSAATIEMHRSSQWEYNEPVDWDSHNFYAAEAAVWNSYGFDPEEAAEWRAQDFKPSEAARMKEEGYSLTRAKNMCQGSMHHHYKLDETFEFKNPHEEFKNRKKLINES